MRRNPNSLLPRFYGVYSMKHEGIGGMIRFVVMNNIFNTPFSPVEKYDLKGTVSAFTQSFLIFLVCVTANEKYLPQVPRWVAL